MNSFYGWLSADPPVLVHSADDNDIGRYLPNEPVIRFVVSMWHHTAEYLAMTDDVARTLRPAHSINYLVNDPTICRQLVSRGISASFVNSNAFLDERRFDIQLKAEKTFDAVYNGRMAKFKRHALAAKVRKLLVIGGMVAEDDQNDYFQELIERMPNATFTHRSDNRNRSTEEVAALLNQAHVGLCLSAREGAMYACTEYLLCGLPVVSTASQGGRDAWYDSRFTRIVPDDPDAVASAVAELKALKIPAILVRGETLCLMWEHRKRFLDLGQTIYAAHQVGRDFARDFYANFTNKLGDWRDPKDVMIWFERQLCR